MVRSRVHYQINRLFVVHDIISTVVPQIHILQLRLQEFVITFWQRVVASCTEEKKRNLNSAQFLGPFVLLNIKSWPPVHPSDYVDIEIDDLLSAIHFNRPFGSK